MKKILNYLCRENKGMIMIMVTVHLIFAFVFAYAKGRFSHELFELEH